MSRPSHLPPRCPFQSRGLSAHAIDFTSQNTQRDYELRAQHRRFPSQGSLFEEKPSWLDELLTDSETSPKGIFHRRSTSDSVAILEIPTTLVRPISLVSKGDAVSVGADEKSPKPTEGTETGGGFEASCVYGPNSPRQKTKLTHSESSMVSALIENVPRNPLQYLAVDLPSGFNNSNSYVKGDAHIAADDLDLEKASRRHSGQRSRARKLQYIDELERTVNVLQTLEAELAARVASLFQQRVTLSVENKTLNQQIASLHQDKMIKDGQHQSLKNEVVRLKMISGNHRKSKSASYLQMGPAEADPSGTSWQMLDMGKLNLGGNPVSLKHGFRS